MQKEQTTAATISLQDALSGNISKSANVDPKEQEPTRKTSERKQSEECTDPNFNPKVAELLESNKDFVEETNEKHPFFFHTLGQAHTPKYMMIGCSDARIQPNSLLKLNPGDLFIHRNIANQVFMGDLNANSAIQYAVEGLNIRDIFVMGHSKCGGVIASMNKIPFEVVDQWISSIREIYETHKPLFKDMTEDQKINALAKINVRHQCMNIRKSATLRRAREKGIVVRILGGHITIDSAPGKGCTVSVVFPTCAPHMHD